jgi:competence protein ComEC
MLLNNKYSLDPDVSERLRESATFHTLVISGFHITVLAWFVIRVRLPVRARRRGESSTPRVGTGRVVAAILVLWAYTVMVGLAPPVTRATLMVSIGLFAPLLFRRAASINTVSMAAFLMLAVKPALVADAGFQLSFLAVAAIVAAGPRLD